MIVHPAVKRHRIFIIGIAGAARSGKDMAADALAACGYYRIALADPIKQMIGGLDKGHLYDREHGRDLWQFGGTEVGREIDPELWLKNFYFQLTMMHLKKGVSRFVISDIRFPNEARAIREDWGGAVIKVWRPGSPRIEQSSHASESQVDELPYDMEIANTEFRLDENLIDRHLFNEQVFAVARKLEEEWKARPVICLPESE